MTVLLRSLASVMPILFALAQPSCAWGVSTLIPITSAPSALYSPRPAVVSHSSWVQTPLNAAGKKSSTVCFLPRLSLSLTSLMPSAVLHLRRKSGAFEPTAIGMDGGIEDSVLPAFVAGLERQH